MDEECSIASVAPERVEGDWLVVCYSNTKPIRFDARQLDRVLALDGELVLAVGQASMALEMQGGAAIAGDIAAKLSRLTRSAPIACSESYDAAKRRLAVLTNGDGVAPPPMFFGRDAVYVSNRILHVGECSWRLRDLVPFARVSATFQAPGGPLQAAWAFLLAAIEERKEDVDALSARVAAYQSTTVTTDNR